MERIELVDLIFDFGINPADAIGGGYVLLTKDGNDTLLQFDKDGVGGSAAVTLATFVDVTITIDVFDG